MAHTHNMSNKSQSFMSGIGNKVKQIAEIAGAIKGIYDTGRMVYGAVSPFIGPAVTTLGLL